ncbi:MAG: metallophosphoesterase [Nanoarchaeota archaeon]
MEKGEVIQSLLRKGYLVSPDIFTFKDDLKIISLLEGNFSDNGFLVVNKHILDSLELLPKISFTGVEKERVLLEKGRDSKYNSFFELLKTKKIKEASETKPNLKIVKNYTRTEKKIELQDFVDYFKNRYKNLREILEKRTELMEVISINKVMNKKDKEKATIIGIVMNKEITKNGNFIFDVEDLTGRIKLIVGKNDNELYNLCKEVSLDEVVGIIGSFSKGVLFGRKIIFPDVPLTKELKKCPDDIYLVCTSDIHVGSRLFYREDFLNFIEWVNGNIGDEKQKEIARKIKYITMTGDLVAGVGVYPGQDKDLEIKDIREQYKELAFLLSKIRKDVLVILCPGDHDAVMVSEPQPILDKDFCKDLFELENIVLVTNPAFLNLHSSENFSGFDTVLYHGHSFIYYADNVESIRSNGWTSRGDLIMKYLLQRRHLSPTHTATLYIPDPKQDLLLLDIIPDFIITGHLHQISNLNYRNVSLIGCGCWEGLTPYQEKTGSKTDTAKVTLVNLKTRDVKILSFLKQNLEEVKK